MEFEKLYESLRKKSQTKSLQQAGKEVFETLVNRTLQAYVQKIDKYGDVEAHWVLDDEDTSKSSRDLDANYSIDINADGVEVDGYGRASVNTSGQYGCLLEFYRNSERGDEHDYMMRVNAAGSTPEKFVLSLFEKVKRVFEKARED